MAVMAVAMFYIGLPPPSLSADKNLFNGQSLSYRLWIYVVTRKTLKEKVAKNS